MKKKYLFLIIFIISVVEAKEYAVVVQKGFANISVGKIKAIYLKKLKYQGDTKLVPINLGSQNSVRRSFEKKVLKIKHSRLKSYWIKQHYLGQRPPITLKSEAAVNAFVKKVFGAIGYLEAAKADKDLKIIYKWSD
ncbi:hypothetical protein LCX93_00385 [Sulfurimonas sp. SWIR-19]|uniref:hypothetical protein n=1 Tax=Sulfurimonas sp. SWIR-19 TaxID=2878390 RepID=UPI001CF20B39|nr:hypothetical protein [Sulfurimonas sp. SWIR-19]UCN00404.1 hypothetical protein LCX93_00385 [Sulfurimonas sp. SWIR-19]